MIAPLTIVGVSTILMIVSISIDWRIKIGKASISLYWFFCLLGAILCLIFGFAGENAISNIFFNNFNINPLKILVIFLSCTSISVLLDKIGFFSYIASVVLKKSKSNQTKLFFSFSLIIALLTIFTSNDILILTFTPFICYFAKHAKIDPTPYIVSEFVCANVWSMFFFIDNPTNIYLCSTFEITFIEYATKMILPTILSGATASLLVYLIFRKKLKQKIAYSKIEITKPEKGCLIIGLVGLFSMIFLMAISNYIGFEIWYISLICAIATYLCATLYLATTKKVLAPIGHALKALPYSIIPFLLSMSVFIAVLENIGVVNSFADFLSSKGVFVIGPLAFLLGNMLNNIPMTMFFTNTLAVIPTNLSLVYGVVVASNVCALLTPIGSLAGIMFMKILKQNKVDFKFKHFVKYGSLVSIPTLFVALVMIFIL